MYKIYFINTYIFSQLVILIYKIVNQRYISNIQILLKISNWLQILIKLLSKC